MKQWKDVIEHNTNHVMATPASSLTPLYCFFSLTPLCVSVCTHLVLITVMPRLPSRQLCSVFLLLRITWISHLPAQPLCINSLASVYCNTMLLARRCSQDFTYLTRLLALKGLFTQFILLSTVECRINPFKIHANGVQTHISSRLELSPCNGFI